MMASCGEAQESDILTAGIEEVVHLLRNKNLYLSSCGTTFIVGIKMELSTNRLELLGKEKPVIIENPVIICKWDIDEEDARLPVTMGILVKDSKVYMIGGEYPNDITCMYDECCSISTLSELVYEFSISDGGRPTFSPCSSVPPMPMPNPAPIIVKHSGDTYVLYGMSFSDTCYHVDTSESELENSFVVWRKDGMGWESLPPPPPFSYRMWSSGVFGGKLYVEAGNRMFCYDIKSQHWEEKRSGNLWRYAQGSLTLSLSVPTTEAEGQSSYVVIYTRYSKEFHEIGAALVDGDGKVSQIQCIHDATGFYDGISMGSFKLIELVPNKDSSTFALVFCQGDRLIGLTVFRVSLLYSSDKKVGHVAKRQKLSEGNEFLKAELLVNQRYITKGHLDCGVIRDAFFF